MTEDAPGRTGASRTHAPRAARSMVLAIAALAACAPGSPPAPAAEPLVATSAPPPAAQIPVASPPIPADLRPEERAVVELFEETSPSVVYITTLARRADWFGRPMGEVPQGTGTGFVWDDDGHVITNAHVIAGRGITGIEVVMSDQTTYDAEFVGASASHDLAVLLIDAPSEALRPIALGDSDGLRVGQSVLAIGNPFGLSATLTTGIVSALGRRIEGLDRTPIEDVIQTDAAINQGNSGGPLLDSAGRVIGVNTQIFSPSGASAGVGFAVPVNTVRRVVPQLIESGVYRPPQLGIQAAHPSFVQRLRTTGVLVAQTTAGSGASAAGLRGTEYAGNRIVRLGDIIQQIDGEPIRSLGELRAVLDRYRPGDEVTVTILRDILGDGELLEVTVRLASGLV